MPALVTVLMILSKSPESEAEASDTSSRAAVLATMHQRAIHGCQSCVHESNNSETETHQFCPSSLRTLIG